MTNNATASKASESSRVHPNARFLEDFTEGQTFTSPGRTVTEADIVAFAGLTADYNPLHCDAEFAAGTPFGKPIAHGLLGLSMAVGLQSRLGIIDGTVLAFLECSWKFVKPTFAGDTLQVRVTVKSARRSKSNPDRGIVVVDAELTNQRDEIVQQGTWTFLMRARTTG